MRIAIHTSIGTFVSRILRQDEYDDTMRAFGRGLRVVIENQEGGEFDIPPCVHENSVIESINDAAIAAVPKLKG